MVKELPAHDNGTLPDRLQSYSSAHYAKSTATTTAAAAAADAD